MTVAVIIVLRACVVKGDEIKTFTFFGNIKLWSQITEQKTQIWMTDQDWMVAGKNVA